MRAIFLLSIATVLFACHSKNAPAPAGPETFTLDTAALAEDHPDTSGPLYPFTQFINDQLTALDSLPLAVEMHTFMNGRKTDSTIISKQAFKKAMEPILADDPNRQNLRPYYREESFEDLSLEAITFTITTKNPALPLQEATVLLNPKTKAVKTIIIKRQWQTPDSTAQQTILWKANMHCHINSLITPKAGKAYQRSIQYIWDRPLE